MKEEIMQALIAGEEVASEDVLEYINDLKEQVRKETAKEILEDMDERCPSNYLGRCLWADRIKNEYGIEVDE